MTRTDTPAHGMSGALGERRQRRGTSPSPNRQPTTRNPQFRPWFLLACLLLPLLVACGNPLGGRTGSASRGNGVTPTPLTDPASGSALVEQAVAAVLDHYVDPLNSGDLFGAAYDGALETLRAAGKASGGQAGQPAQRPSFTGDRKRDAEIFRGAYLALLGPAGAEAGQTAVAYGAIRGMVERVDECHTSFLTPEQYAQFTAHLQGQENYGGIGVSIRGQERPVTIGEVFRGSPAEAAGLRRGDAILAVDGTDVTGLGVDQVGPLVRGPEGSQVRLTIRRPGEAAPRDVTITRARITVPVFTSSIEPGPNGTKVGYMHLYSFSEGAEKELQKALEEFERAGVTGWVLDLRDNGGGLITTLSAISSRFVKDGKPVAYAISRGEEPDPIKTDKKLFFKNQQPFAVLINEGSASSSEAFASAAQDYGFARLFGETSAGCLGGASDFPLADGSAMQITVAKVVSPQRREINRVGVKPDETVEEDGTNRAGGDPVLDAAINWLATQR
ncbi:MAG: S41 family peptidase [Chloroflexota bacterium]|nr:S41 family peptidase [Chloroflexota bacterium]